MSLAMLNKDRLVAAIMLYTILLALLFIVSMITLFLYSTNQENKQNILAAQEPISIKVNIGATPPVQVVTVPVVKQPEVTVVEIE